MSPDKLNKDSPQPSAFKAGAAMLIGLEMGVAVAIGYFIGSFLDKKLDSSPWLTLVFFIFGVTAAFRLLFQRARMIK